MRSVPTWFKIGTGVGVGLVALEAWRSRTAPPVRSVLVGGWCGTVAVPSGTQAAFRLAEPTVPTLSEDRWNALQQDFLGLGHTVFVAPWPGRTATTVRRVYLDAAATALMPRKVWRGIERYLETSPANAHTHANAAGRATTAAIERSRALVGELVGADPDGDLVVFVGHGTTGAANRLARALFGEGVEVPLGSHDGSVLTLRTTNPRDLVVLSSMEHHSGMLPWVGAVGYDRLRFFGLRADGTLDLDDLRAVLDHEGDRVRVVVVTGVSNVTGVINPIHEVARLAHAVGAEVVVDAAQMAPHVPLEMHPLGDAEGGIDHVVLSGHKLYAPGSPGVLVTSARTFPASRVYGDLGGGAVEYVALDEARFKATACDREEAGTPNIPGTIGLGIAAGLLLGVGMDRVRIHEAGLVEYALGRLATLPEVTVYGPRDVARVPRSGVIAFNVQGLPHGVVARALDDYFGIAVRNDCFCAQPYVRAQLGASRAVAQGLPGMVRVSFGLFTTREDVDALVEALRQMVAQRAYLTAQYVLDADGAWVHRTWRSEPPFSLDDDLV